MNDYAFWFFSTIPQVFAATIAVLFVLYGIRERNIKDVANSRSYSFIKLVEIIPPVNQASHASIRSKNQQIENLNRLVDNKRYRAFGDAVKETAKLEDYKPYAEQLSGIKEDFYLLNKKLNSITDHFYQTAVLILFIIVSSILMIPLLPVINEGFMNFVILIFGILIFSVFVKLADLVKISFLVSAGEK